MERNNEMWLEHLSGAGFKQQAALSDLRDALLRGLQGALWKWRFIDDSFLEDAVQDALLRILDRLPQFEGRSRFLTWATAIAIHVAVNELRRKHWSNISLDDVIAGTDSSHETIQDHQSRPDIQLENESLRTLMIKKLHEMIRNELTDKQRTALLAELKGMPQNEIAKQLGSNRNAIYKLTHDARKRLKHGLELAGYRAEDLNSAFEH
ncbi:MAG: sigma-70 family RNA polymerase sigma factor [Anaerolineae bacterium]|nr:sigma-70 family RNA polymerase sigma factor [Anaerolineae bacterium]